mmetsp:Transcript_18443/g.50922  ORF Transcript_18443/g.50922 Transcript_18443/m.50922 type:complete len:92 (-) Transcript_18443:263-538(-)
MSIRGTTASGLWVALHDGISKYPPSVAQLPSIQLQWRWRSHSQDWPVLGKHRLCRRVDESVLLAARSEHPKKPIVYCGYKAAGQDGVLVRL